MRLAVYLSLTVIVAFLGAVIINFYVIPAASVWTFCCGAIGYHAYLKESSC